MNNKMQSIKIGLLKFIPVILCYLSLSCRNNVAMNESGDTKWLIQNETKINSELSKIISERRAANKKDTLWIEKSFVITEYDTTILGAFAKRIKEINRCFDVMYTYSRKTQKRKKITIIRDTSGQCVDNATKPFSLIDSTRYLEISFDTLHPM